MDRSYERFAYRCLPLLIANASGWEILSPCRFEATWNGGNGKDAVQIRALDDYPHLDRHVVSHFGHGILTFHPGYLFRTDPGWGLWARGAPNLPKDSIQPLDGLVETDWLSFTFTMNWAFTRPSVVIFEREEPICFITPLPHLQLDSIQPIIEPIEDRPDVKAEYDNWYAQRTSFNEELARSEPDAIAMGWQRWYTQGSSSLGHQAPATHLSKRKLKAPLQPSS